MQKKMFRSMTMAVLLAIVFITMVMTFVFYGSLKERIFKDEKSFIDLIEKTVADYGTEGLKKINEYAAGYRITYISPDGEVLYDSEVSDEKLSEMPNHKNRPEVKEARENGSGTSARISSTVAEKTYYYAIKMEEGYVLRIAVTEKSEMAAIFKVLPELFLTVLLILGLTLAVSKWQTKKIVQPINEIDLHYPEESEIYDEIAPFIERIIKQRKVIEQQLVDLRNSRIEIEAITENMEEGLLVIDKNSNVISCNRSAKEFFHVQFEKENPCNYMTFSRNEKFTQGVEQAFLGNRSQLLLEFGQGVYQMIASPVLIEETVDGVVVLILDATEKEQREALRREFSANVSHELKTPLTSISGYAEIMENRMVKEEDMYQFAGIIHKEALRLIDLVEDIIKISRLDENQVELGREKVDLYELANSNIGYLREKAQKRHVDMVLLGKSAWVDGVRQILDEMIHNVIENAVKYNKENGNVIVSVDEGAESVIFTVKDSGIGIPKEEQGRVFERFYRVDKSHSREIGGTGLGLSIVKHGAIFHHAKIEMESEIGKGTEIKILFPKNTNLPQMEEPLL